MLALTTAETARLALVVSAISAAIALTGLVWQLTLYRLTGARVVVRLIPGVLTEAGNLMRGPARGWGRKPPKVIDRVGNRPWVDVGIIEVINVGRTPISVAGLTFDVGSDPIWKPWRRYTIGMPPVPLHGALADVTAVRLEPADAVFAMFDVWPTIEAGRAVRKKVRVRASVTPAGRRKKRSAFRHRWKIGKDQRRVWPYGPEGDQVALFQAVWRAVAPIAPTKTYDAWLAVTRLIMPRDLDPKDLTITDVQDALDEIVDRFAVWPLVSILNALHEHGKAGAWVPRLPKPEAREEPN